jgi:hypothetical protein
VCGRSVRGGGSAYFTHPSHEPDSAKGLEAQLLDERQRLKRQHEAGAVVLRALAQVPAVDAAAKHDDLLGAPEQVLQMLLPPSEFALSPEQVLQMLLPRFALSLLQ